LKNSPLAKTRVAAISLATTKKAKLKTQLLAVVRETALLRTYWKGGSPLACFSISAWERSGGVTVHGKTFT
jgi:hypothetical protein